jgi:hypothetical protein
VGLLAAVSAAFLLKKIQATQLLIWAGWCRTALYGVIGVSRGIGEFNPDKHYYRPIPQSFLDGITNESGAALTNEEKQAMQNPGY